MVGSKSQGVLVVINHSNNYYSGGSDSVNSQSERMKNSNVGKAELIFVGKTQNTPPKFTHGKECSEGISSLIEKGLTELVTCTTRATFTCMLQRILALTDDEVIVFVNSLRNCGMVADETGHLLPMLFFHIRRESLIENYKPAQFARLHDVMAFADIDTCIHGRSILGDAMVSLARLIRSDLCESAELIREMLRTEVDTQVFSRLVMECEVFRNRVKQYELTAMEPPPGSRWWNERYYIPISVFESMAREAMRAVEGKRTKRTWWRF